MIAPYIVDSKWGLPRSFWYRPHGRVISPPHGMDSPDKCVLGDFWWHAYPVQDYTYSYNSWGFRGPEYEQLEGKKINICIGDSMTMNIGGPIEHSWPSQLSNYFSIPTLNFAIDGLSYTLFPSILEKVSQFFDIDKIFLLWNTFVYDNESHVIKVYNNSGASERIKILKSFCWISDAYWQFDPPWTFDKEDLKCLYEHFPEAHRYVDIWKRETSKTCPVTDFDDVQNTKLHDLYQAWKGDCWMSYNDFCQMAASQQNISSMFDKAIDKRLIHTLTYLYQQKYTCNRDGWHMNRDVNAALAKYFYQQTLLQ